MHEESNTSYLLMRRSRGMLEDPQRLAFRCVNEIIEGVTNRVEVPHQLGIIGKNLSARKLGSLALFESSDLTEG